MTDDDAARKTYRYLRLGMIGAVALLAASVGLERLAAPGCWQTSISAYYYTPARGVFVGALVAVGLSLIVIKGSTRPEEICLNAAGMLAPVVALMPTSGAGSCWSIKPEPLPTRKVGEDTEFERWVLANINNNVKALLIAGSFGVVLAAVIAFIAMRVRRPPGQGTTVIEAVKRNKGPVLSVFVAGATLAGFVTWRLVAPEVFNERAHGFAAFAMFTFLAAAALANAWDTKEHGRSTYALIYLLIGGAMAATAALFLVPDKKWAHKVLWIEILEIAWFLLLWTVQTRELWHDTLRHSDHANVPTVTGPDPAREEQPSENRR